MLLVERLETPGIATGGQFPLGCQQQQLFRKLRDQFGHELALRLGQAHLLVCVVKAQHQLVAQQMQLFLERPQFFHVLALVIRFDRLPLPQPCAFGLQPGL
ncbi:hypothetical protein D3C71_1433920 [compost metagenome]